MWGSLLCLFRFISCYTTSHSFTLLNALSVILDSIPCQFKSLTLSLINALYTFLHLFHLFCLNRSKINAKITRTPLLENNYSVRCSQKSQTAQKSRGRTLVEPDTIRKPNYLYRVSFIEHSSTIEQFSCRCFI